MQTKTPEELNEYLHEAPEMGNYATGWRHYLRFLLEQLNAEEQPIQRQPRRERENNVYLLNEYWQYAMYESEKPFETEDGFNSYLTGAKAAMRTYDLKIEDLEDMNKEQIQNLIDRAGEKLNGNYPSHWRHYLRFLLTRI